MCARGGEVGGGVGVGEMGVFFRGETDIAGKGDRGCCSVNGFCGCVLVLVALCASG